MMTQHKLAVVALLLLLASCRDPAVEHRLSQEQLAWQGYRVGEVLRFGHARDGRVRTYRITEVQDRLQTDYRGYASPVPLPQSKPPKYQELTVLAQRTDTVGQSPRPVLSLELHYDLASVTPALWATAQWETFYQAELPLNEVNGGTAIDTVRYAARLLPSATFGSTTYASVIRVDNRRYPGTTPLQRETRRLYYALGKGVVAFEEVGNDLWYRLP